MSLNQQATPTIFTNQKSALAVKWLTSSVLGLTLHIAWQLETWKNFYKKKPHSKGKKLVKVNH